MAVAGLLALLDDISVLLDDVAGMTKQAAVQTAPVMSDDIAVNAKQVYGVPPKRELYVVWEVTKGSFRNKAILVPAAVLISFLLPAAITPLLMCGGLYLCFEGAENIWQSLFHKKKYKKERQKLAVAVKADPLIAEKVKIKKAILTDLILSAEIIAISLGLVTEMVAQDASFIHKLGTQFGTLTAIGFGATVFIYALVALFVKLDDAGFWLLKRKVAMLKKVGYGIVEYGAPFLSKALGVLGTIAMLTVGGGIMLHGLPKLMYGFAEPVHLLEHMFHDIPLGEGFILPSLFGLLIGAVAVTIEAPVAGLVKSFKLERQGG